MQDNNENKNEEEPTVLVLKYKSGIPTIRSSSHRSRQPINNSNDQKKKGSKQTQKQPKKGTTTPTSAAPSTATTAAAAIDNESDTIGTILPACMRKVRHIPYDTETYDFNKAIIQLLNGLDATIVGGFKDRSEVEYDKNNNNNHDNVNVNEKEQPLLEHFEVPVEALSKKSKKRGILLSQEHLSKAMHDAFLGSNNNDQMNEDDKSSSTTPMPTTALIVSTFDKYITEFIAPYLKTRLIEEDIISESSKIKFYYQRPPTLRIQPGPGRAKVNRHKDKDYGHQNGELNFWIPLTNRLDTGVDLYVESEEDEGDYKPLETDVGYVSSFFGTGCSHFVNENISDCTRVSLDFRVGIEPFYDPFWSKAGTRDDHLRRSVEM